MRYHGTVIRPPSEADSYILQATYGCSHNRCTFCGTYPDKPFAMRPMEEVLEDIALAGRRIPHTPRVFIADGNALVMPAARLVTILDALDENLPDLRRVGIYASASDILAKSDEELACLNQKKLQIIYLGLESGNDEVLQRIDKNITAAEMIEAVHKAKRAGIRVSVIALLGLGGLELSDQHAADTGQVVSAMDPHYLSMLTLMLVPGTPLHRDAQEGKFQLPPAKGMLSELRAVIENTDDRLTRCVFRTNHASNYLPLAGVLCRDKTSLLATIDEARSRGPDALRPETWRAL